MTTNKPKTGNFQFLKDFMMGGIAGATAKTLCAPIERVKLLMQTQATNPKVVERPYKSITECYVRIFKEEGALAYWRGNWANVLRYFPTTAINFSIKDQLQRIFIYGIDPKKNQGKYFVGNLMAGGIAGAIGLTCVYALDFARTRMAADVGKAEKDREFKGLIHCISKIWKSDGIAGLYRGFQISVIGIFVYRACYFGGYDTGKVMVFGNDEQQKKASLIFKFFFAQIIVTTSETISFPLDTVRRRLMMQSGRGKHHAPAAAAGAAKPDHSAVKYTGTLDCFRKVLKEEGINGFFKGNISNIWRSIGSSLVLVMYDEMKRWLLEHDTKQN